MKCTEIAGTSIPTKISDTSFQCMCDQTFFRDSYRLWVKDVKEEVKNCIDFDKYHLTLRLFVNTYKSNGQTVICMAQGRHHVVGNNLNVANLAGQQYTGSV